MPSFQNVFQNQIEEGTTSCRRSSRSSKFPAKLNDYVLDSKLKYGLNRFANHTRLSFDNCCFVANLNKSCEPSSFEEAYKNVTWKGAMNDEIVALYENDTWEEVDLPEGRVPIGSKWVWKLKFKTNGEIERCKARVVAKVLIKNLVLTMMKHLVLWLKWALSGAC